LAESAARYDPDSARRTALNTVTAWWANVVSLVIGFFMTRFLLDHLGERLYGVYALGASVASWSALAGTPIGNYASRYGTEHLERGETQALDRTMATSLGLALLAMLILPWPVFVCAAQVQRLFRVPDDLVGPARAAILIVGLGTLATVVVRVWEATVFMSRRIYLKNYAEMAARVVGAAVVVVWFLWVGPSVTVWLLLAVAPSLVLSLALVVPAAARGLPVRLLSLGLDRAELRRALPFIGYISISMIGGVLSDNTDSLVISVLPELGISQVAAYDVGSRWHRVVRPFVEALILALSPGLVSLAARGDSRRLGDNVIAHSRQVLLLGMIPTVAMACVARPFISHWVGEQFVARSVPVMWVTLASAFVWGPGAYSARVLIAVSRLRFATIGGIVSGFVNLLLSVLFVRVLGLGLLGIAGGTLVANVLWCDIALGFEACRGVGLRPLAYFRGVWLRPAVALPVMLLVGVGLARLWTPRSLLETIAQLGVSGVALSGVAFWIGLTAVERAAVISSTARRVARLTDAAGLRAR
jgi:O-antigen/teichoic acid export membrane protein